MRALLKARSGLQRTDSMVRYLVRNAIQIAALATIWAIASLVSWFWLNHILVYRVFDITSGTVYTHVSVSSAARLLSSQGRMFRPYLIPFFPALNSVIAWPVHQPTSILDTPVLRYSLFSDSPNVWPNLIMDRRTRSHSPCGFLAMW